MKIIIGIPARMGASRLPGKPLANILGKPMIEHVFRRSMLAKSVDGVFIAACDEEVKSVVNGFGGTVIMTDRDIMRPGLRVASACEQLNLDDNDIIVVVQGDEPLLHPDMIDIAVQPLIDDPNIKLLTMIAEANEAEWNEFKKEVMDDVEYPNVEMFTLSQLIEGKIIVEHII